MMNENVFTSITHSEICLVTICSFLKSWFLQNPLIRLRIPHPTCRDRGYILFFGKTRWIIALYAKLDVYGDKDSMSHCVLPGMRGQQYSISLWK